MNTRKPGFNLKTLSLLVATAWAAGSGLSQAASPLTLSQKPLYTTLDLAPNLVVTYDDSGSMQFGFVPDDDTQWRDASQVYNSMCYTRDTRRAKSAVYNPIYYNPEITYLPPVKADNSAFSTSFSAAYINGFNTGSPTVNLDSAYKVSWGYTPNSTSLGNYGGVYPYSGYTNNDPSNARSAYLCDGTANILARNPASDFAAADQAPAAGVAAYYYVRDTSLANCTASNMADEDCYKKITVSASSGPSRTRPELTGSPTSTDERQNFANWYSFYRVRNLMVVSSATRAFQTLDSKVRVAWQALNSCTSFGTSCAGWDNSNTDNRIAEYNTAHKNAYYSWLTHLPASGGTPLRDAFARVGAYYKTSGAASPYAETPPTTKGTEYACRANYAMVLTDGFWNGGIQSGNVVGNVDNASSTLPDGTSYSPQAPYKDSNSDNMADLAFKYWSTDLRTDLADKVPVYNGDGSDTTYWNPKNDPATWQHLVTFTVGIGLTKGLASSGLTWAGDTYTGSYAALKAGSQAWPATANDAVGNVADLWHAALNSRGQFFSVENPQALVDAFAKILSRVTAGLGASASLNASSTSLSTGSYIYQATYNGKDWSGDLKKWSINSDGSLGSTVWSASTGLASPAFASRVVLSHNGTNGIPFQWGNLSTSQQAALTGTDTAAIGQERLNWIRGDASKEGTYRKRPTTKLGDIVSSGPQYVGMPSEDLLDPGFMSFKLSACATTDAACSSTRAPIVYVGSNDGMLHGFKDSDGTEVLAYIPSEVYSKLANLSSTGYEHKMFVDASPVISSVPFSDKWRSILIGGLGGGGKGVYTLNVTDPTRFTEANANSGGNDRIVLWELNSTTDADVGHIYGKPQFAKMQNGKWAAVFGNGYNSTGTGKSTLFVVFLEPAMSGLVVGTSYVKISAGSGTASAPGGLATPALIDSDNDGKVDLAYAGDIDGNLWKFDLSNATPSNWKVANSGTALYQTNAGQPITTKPAVTIHPRGDYFVIFGTGKALQASDMTDTTVQTLYGVWDSTDMTTRPITQSKLEQRTFTNTSVSGLEYRTIAGSQISWYDAVSNTGKLGWYANLIDTGERLTTDPQLRNGRVIFASAEPNSDPCSAGGSSWLIVIDPITGLETKTTPFDVNKDGKYDSADKISSKIATGVRIGTPGGDVLIQQQCDANGNCTGMATTNKVGTPTGTGLSFDKPSGRLNWRDIAQ